MEKLSTTLRAYEAWEIRLKRSCVGSFIYLRIESIHITITLPPMMRKIYRRRDRHAFAHSLSLSQRRKKPVQPFWSSLFRKHHWVLNFAYKEKQNASRKCWFITGTVEHDLHKLAPLSFAKIAFLLVSAVTSVVGLTCEAPGGTSDDGPAIKAALTQCNNGGTTSRSYPTVHGYYWQPWSGCIGQELYHWHSSADHQSEQCSHTVVRNYQS